MEKVDIKNLSFNDLRSMYLFVSSCPLTNKIEIKELIKARIVEIEEELYRRSFGCNPYKIK